MERFAKLFEDEKYGQILVLLDTDDDGDPCVKFMGKPPGLGICAVSLGFGSEDDAREVFDHIEHQQAVAAIAGTWEFSPGKVAT